MVAAFLGKCLGLFEALRTCSEASPHSPASRNRDTWRAGDHALAVTKKQQLATVAISAPLRYYLPHRGVRRRRKSVRPCRAEPTSSRAGLRPSQIGAVHAAVLELCMRSTKHAAFSDRSSLAQAAQPMHRSRESRLPRGNSGAA